ncbi:tripartite tricarboxylate transporter substrate binding protein [Deinococcus sp. Leaf326]|uniref:tripartite tricarboxylate transporter substrate binding protein n=1 Tax=Deinococcus sp. Leaf326 TaxID=1736338 RepID=UPI0006F617A0|nr:tripartite tricarboxylate transporter substrate binding protein [Deinococcus sp. Leaf326]KQR18739.1 Bug family protein [Deinococcus sp. Leaf326]
MKFTPKQGLITVTTLLLSASLSSSPAAAQTRGATFPEKGKTLQIIVGFAAGGSTDVGARLLAKGLEKELGVPVVVVNRPGAGGQLGYVALTQAKPDGYTIGNTNFPSAVVTYLDPARQATYKRDNFLPLALHVVDPGLFAVRKDSPYKTLKDVIAAAKANPGKITISTTGLQTDEHFAILQLEKMAGVKFAPVHFSQGIAAATTALLGGKIDVFGGNVGDLLGQYKTGEVRILGVMDDRRSPFYPNVPTFAAYGYKLESSASRGFAAPAGTPTAVVNVLSKAIQKVANSEEHKQEMKNLGLTLRYMTPPKYTTYWNTYEKDIRDLLPLSRQ